MLEIWEIILLNIVTINIFAGYTLYKKYKKYNHNNKDIENLSYNFKKLDISM